MRLLVVGASGHLGGEVCRQARQAGADVVGTFHPEYGAAKAAAETAVRLVDPSAAVVRTSLILGDASSKQIRLCLDLLTGRIAGALFSDEIRCPIAVEDLASAVLELVATDYSGRLNVAGPESVTRVEMGMLVAARYDLDPAQITVSTVAESGLRRPAEVRLDVSRASGLLRTRLRGITEVLTETGYAA